MRSAHYRVVFFIYSFPPFLHYVLPTIPYSREPFWIMRAAIYNSTPLIGLLRSSEALYQLFLRSYWTAHGSRQASVRAVWRGRLENRKTGGVISFNIKESWKTDRIARGNKRSTDIRHSRLEKDLRKTSLGSCCWKEREQCVCVCCVEL